MRTSLAINGMHCNACVQRLTQAFESVPGVTSAHVSLSPPKAEIESDRPIPTETLAGAARSAGDYSVRTTEAAPVLETTNPITIDESATPKQSLYPLVLIVLYIADGVALTTYFRGLWAWHTFMYDFMAGFFLVFSFFKLLDLRGFADAYQTYDFLARRFRMWAFLYPFVELFLGVAYLIRWQLFVTNIVTAALMLVGLIGVLRALFRKDRIRCACLGTSFNLPMTTVTAVEDLGMAVMAIVMLLWKT